MSAAPGNDDDEAAAVAAAVFRFPAAVDFQAVAGMGLLCTVAGKRVAIGNRSLMRAEAVEGVVESVEARAQALEDQGKTCIFAGIDGTLAAIMAIADTGTLAFWLLFFSILFNRGTK